MNYDYIERKKKPVVDDKYVYEIANKYYPGMQEVLSHLETVESTFNFMTIKKDAEERISAMVDAARQEKEAERLISKQDEDLYKSMLVKNVARNISAIFDFSTNDIEKAFKSVIKNKDNLNKSEREITQMVIKRLNEKDKPKKAVVKKESFPAIDTTTMKDLIGNVVE